MRNGYRTMKDSRLDTIVKRDRRVVLSSLFGVVGLAWLYLVALALGMDDMAAMGNAVVQARATSWSVSYFGLMFLMWAVMMVGMMMPSASPMILMFARINRDHRARDEPFVPTAIFVTGYIAIWSVFSLAATMAQWALQEAGLLSAMMAGTNAIFGGLVLFAAGLYQWTPLKDACLRHCQTPLSFLMTRWRDGASGAFRMGLAHGAYCVGCCWVLMTLLFVGGVMNLLWVAALAAFVFVEKVVPPHAWLSRLAGMALVAWGGWVLAGAL